MQIWGNQAPELKGETDRGKGKEGDGQEGRGKEAVGRETEVGRRGGEREKMRTSREQPLWDSES